MRARTHAFVWGGGAGGGALIITVILRLVMAHGVCDDTIKLLIATVNYLFVLQWVVEDHGLQQPITTQHRPSLSSIVIGPLQDKSVFHHLFLCRPLPVSYTALLPKYK